MLNIKTQKGYYTHKSSNLQLLKITYAIPLCDCIKCGLKKSTMGCRVNYFATLKNFKHILSLLLFHPPPRAKQRKKMKITSFRERGGRRKC